MKRSVDPTGIRAFRPGVLRGRGDGALGAADHGNRTGVTGRRSRQWAAVLSIVAMLLMGASPALADEGIVDPGAGSSEQGGEAVTTPPAGSPETPAETGGGDTPPPADPPPAEPVPPAPTDGAGDGGAGSGDGGGAGAVASVPQTAELFTAEAEDPQPPYLRWVVVDAADPAAAPLQQATSFTLQGPRNAAAAVDAEEAVQWAGSPTSTVEDNYGQEGYSGLDLDARLGWFTVKQLVDDATAATYDVAALAEGYRVRPASAPAGFAVGETAEWTGFDSAVAALPDEQVQRVALAAPVQAPEAQGREAALEAVISPLALLLPDCGTSSGCAGLTITTVISGGGPATVGDWALKAVRNNASADEYPFTSGAAGTVPRNEGGSTNTFYTLSATANADIQKWYTPSLNCQPLGSPAGTNNQTTFNSSNSRVTFGRGTGGTPTTRYANCTFTQTYTATKIHIAKVGDRTGTGLTAGAPLDGVTFTARASSGGGSPAPTGPVIGTCITVGGVCDIMVANEYANGVWIEETGGPAGWSPITAIGTGDYNSAKTATPYRFRVAVGSGSGVTTKNVTADADRPDSSVSGAWVDVRDNPGFPGACGLSIAMVFDTSASINQSEMTSFKNAASNFVGPNGLGGTPSSVTMFRFDTTAGTMNNGTAFAVATAGAAGNSSGIGGSGYLGAQNAIANGLPSAGNSNGYTNWDNALQLVKATGNFDMVLFLTDGDPTTYGSGSTTNTNVQFRMVEQAAMSANAIKAADGPSGAKTKIVGVGVGLSTNSYLNLQAISGPNSGDDYFLASNFDLLESKLQEIAVKNCASTLTVIKQIQNPDGTVKTANAAGWTFTATGDVVNGSPAVKETTTSGTNFPLTFNDTNNHVVTVDETAQAGYEYIGASCTNAAGAVTKTATGFTVPLKTGLITSCTVINRETQQPATVQLNKTWVVKDQNNVTLETYYLRGNAQDPAAPAWLLATPTLTPAPNPAPGPGGLQWGTAYSGYVKDGKVNVGETASLGVGAPPGCTLTSKQLTSGPGVQSPVNIASGPHEATLGAGSNVFGITNTVTCTTSLTLLKEVDKTDVPTSTLQPSDWKLTAVASPAAPVLNGVTGSGTVSAANTANVIAGTSYTLSEASVNGQLAYTQLGIQKCETVSGSGPSATCTAWASGYITGDEVTVALGQHGIYRFVNQPIPPITVPLTGGMSADLFGLWGGGIAILAVLLGVFTVSRLRRQSEAR